MLYLLLSFRSLTWEILSERLALSQDSLKQGRSQHSRLRLGKTKALLPHPARAPEHGMGRRRAPPLGLDHAPPGG